MKYIVEIKPEYEDSFKGLMILGAKDSNLFVDALAVEDIEELNSDYINEHFGDLQDTAYQRGLEDGKKAFDLLDAEHDSEYQRGLDDAWEAAGKIAQQWEEDADTEHRLVIDDSIRVTLDSMTASEAIAKLKAYEEKQKADDDIKVGDVVKPRAGVARIEEPFVVTKVSNKSVWGVDAEGSWNYWAINEVTKTDKHFDIDKILEEMKE